MQTTLNLEPIEISIVLSSTFWKDPPKVRTYIDDNLIFDGEITDQKTIKWVGELTEDKHKLVVELYGKDKYQTILENNKIVKDQLLNIESIEFDEIEIGNLKHSLSNYYPVDVQEPIKNCVNLGWNGRWEFEFTTPIYIWLLENI
jgi:hypothetical protein